jgi:glutamine phosphoribosylpyrophosphate amidotransferase
MCGIVGFKPLEDNILQVGAFQRLFHESRIRGLHAYGIATGDSVYRTFDSSEIQQHFDHAKPTIAHARYSQSGDWHVLENNQPIVVGNMALAHNGVISMGTKAEYEAQFDVQCTVDNDSEIFLRCLERGETPEAFLDRLSGSFAGVWLRDGVLYAGRNPRRPLWKCHSYGAMWYASTEDIFRRAGFFGPEPVAVGAEVA